MEQYKKLQPEQQKDILTQLMELAFLERAAIKLTKTDLLRMMQAHLRRALLFPHRSEEHINLVMTMIDDMVEEFRRQNDSTEQFKDRAFTQQPPDTGTRQAVADIRVVPNLHLDKDVLTPHELQELLAWGAETLGTGSIPEVALIEIRGRPNSVANRMVDFIGTAGFGPNNYIGPGKTGNMDGVLQDIVSSVPAMSEADRLAMRHDILLTQAELLGPEAVERAHSVLQSEPIMYAAQALYPAFQHNGQFNYDRLMSEGIEPNPGPRYDFTSMNTVNELIMDMEDPTNAGARICNALANNAAIDEKMYVEQKGAFSVKSGLNDRLDIMQMNSNWQEIDGVLISSSGGMRFQQHSQSLKYVMRNLNLRETLPKTKFAQALDAALVDYSTYTATQRTNNNVVSGSNDLSLYTLTPNADFGMYDSMTKLHLYEACKQRLSGTASVNQISDVMVVKNESTFPFSGNYFPGSVGIGVGIPPVIDAYLINSSDMNGFIRNGQWPFDFDPINSMDVACVFVQGGITPAQAAILTVTHLEFPYREHRYAVDYVAEAPNNGVPIHTPIATNFRPVSLGSYIQGPKFKVLYVWLTPSQQDLVVGNVTVNYAAPALQDIVNGLDFAYVQYMNDLGQSPLWQQTANILLNFMNISDWRASMLMAINLARWKAPHHGLGQMPGNVAVSDPIYFSSTAAPSFDISIPAIDTNTVAAGSIDALINNIVNQPVYTPQGQPTVSWVMNSPRPASPITNYFQQSSFLTRYGVLAGFYEKQRLTNVIFQKTCKVVFRQLWQTMKRMSDKLSQCAHNWYQKMGITNQDMYPTQAASLVQNNSVNYFQSLHDHQNVMQTAICGIPIDSFPVPYAYTTDLLADNYGFHRQVWVDTSIYLFNHLINWKDPAASLFYPDLPLALTSNVSLDLVLADAPLGPSPQQAVVLFAGVNLTRTGMQRLLDAFEGTIAQPGAMKLSAKRIFSLLQMNHSLNPGMYVDVLRYFTYRQDDANYVKYQNIKCFTNEFLRYDSNDADSFDARKGRPNFFLLLPFNPPAQDAASGRQLYPAFYASSNVRGIKTNFSLDGTGSVNSAFTTAVVNPNAGYLLPPVMGGDGSKN